MSLGLPWAFYQQHSVLLNWVKNKGSFWVLSVLFVKRCVNLYSTSAVLNIPIGVKKLPESATNKIRHVVVIVDIASTVSDYSSPTVCYCWCCCSCFCCCCCCCCWCCCKTRIRSFSAASSPPLLASMCSKHKIQVVHYLILATVKNRKGEWQKSAMIVLR